MSGRASAPRSEEVRRAAVTQLDRAVLHLGLLDTEPVLAVHEARKSIKRTRASLLLLHEADAEALEVEDTVLGNAARLLGGIRDQHVARQLEAARRGDERPVPPPPLSPLVRTWVAQSSTILLGVRQRSNEWNLTSISGADLLAAHGRSYRTARRRWRNALDSLDPDDLHRCRSVVKRTFYQLEVLIGDPSDERIAAFDLLGELLGRHHDEYLLFGRDEIGEELIELEAAIGEVGSPLMALSTSAHLRWLRRTIKVQRRSHRR